MNKAIFNAKHAKTAEFDAGHERGHLGAKRVAYQNPPAYNKAIAKYQGYINNLKKRGIELNKHDSEPEEYIADDVGRKTTSTKDAVNAMRDLKKQHIRNDDYSAMSKEELKDLENTQREVVQTINNLDKMLKDPGYYLMWDKIRVDKKRMEDLYKQGQKLQDNKHLKKVMINSIEARIKAIKANEKEDIKKNLPDAKFKYDRGKYKLVNPKK